MATAEEEAWTAERGTFVSSLVSNGEGVAAMRPLDWRRRRMAGRVREGAPALVAAVELVLIMIDCHGASWFHI